MKYSTALEWKTFLIAIEVFLPLEPLLPRLLGAAAGGISGTVCFGAAQGLGLAGGSYAGYKGGKALADYLEDSDMLSGLGSGGKDAVRLALSLGGTALGGIGGTSLAGALVPKGYLINI